MLKSLFTSLSGLRGNSLAMGAIGNNIANVNTIGFKASRPVFADLLGATMGSLEIGGGVRMSSVLPNFTQGSISTTGNNMDIAIDGDGFFIVSDGSGDYYTRAGQFILDKDGYMVTPEGYRLQGWAVNDNGSLSGVLGDINLSNIVSEARATSSVDLKVNLDAMDDVPTGAFDPNDPSTYNYSTAITVYDSLGNSHAVTVYFVKTGANAWTAHYYYSDALGSTVEAGTQNITFNSDGSLKQDNSGTAVSFDFGGGAAVQDIVFDYGTGTDEGGTGLDGSTQFSLPSSTTFLGQDGYPAGSLKDISINDDGTIDGLFTNGQVKHLYKIALANFVSPWNLAKVGDNLYAATGNSGQPIIGPPLTGGRGKVLSGSLEMSNVDLAAEFTNIILTQRAFQANSRVITTSDEILTEVVNLKR